MSRILYLNAGGEISGAERSLLAMLDALHGTHITPIVAAPEGPLLAECAARGVQTTAVPLLPLARPRSLGDVGQLLSTVRRGAHALTHLMTELQPDLLHANSAPAMLYATRVRGVPLLWHVRDLRGLPLLGRLLYRRATRVLAISDAVRQALLSVADDRGEKIALLPPAVDTARFRPSADRAHLRAELGLPLDGPLIGLVAQLVPWKRHHLLLDALERLADRPWHLVLAGADLHDDATYRAALQERLARPPFTGRVSWLPWQAQPERLLAALDVLALTSQQEPFGRVLIEAMACAVPVLAVAEGGPCDIVQHGVTGLLAPADAAALAAALATLLDDAAYRTTMGQAGRAYVEARFGLPQHRHALLDLYQSVLGTPKAR